VKSLENPILLLMLIQEWNTPSPDLILPDHEVHIWRTQLDQNQELVQQLAQILSEDERSRSSHFRFDRDRLRFIVGRGVLRTILAKYLNIYPSEVTFCYGAYGKPALPTSGQQRSYQFNLSHSQGLAVYAISLNRSVGIDIEHIRPVEDMQGIVERFFSAHEQDTFAKIPENKKCLSFFQCWTSKEAYLKARGDGLTQALHHIEVSIVPGQNTQLLNIVGNLQEVQRWTLHKFQPLNQFIGVIAVEGSVAQFKYWQL
jgi:4'-phosphopantetheinyl transferase